jgi:histone deacetylase 1/2
MNEYYEYFGPDFELDVRSSNMNDLNTREYLDRVKRIVLENLRQIGGPPGIQMTGLSGCLCWYVSSLLTCFLQRCHD